MACIFVMCVHGIEERLFAHGEVITCIKLRQAVGSRTNTHIIKMQSGSSRFNTCTDGHVPGNAKKSGLIFGGASLG